MQNTPMSQTTLAALETQLQAWNHALKVTQEQLTVATAAVNKLTNQIAALKALLDA